MKLSIIVPSIRTPNWGRFVESIPNSVVSHDYEVIFVGPSSDIYLVEVHPNVKWIKDFGSPARCAQIGFILAEGEYLTWASDDGVYMPGALKECLDIATPDNGVIVKYCEGHNFNGTCPDNSYWIAHTHADQRLPGIMPDYKIAPVGLYHTKTFLELGGLDCRFEHINMNTHDFAFRWQKTLRTMQLSPNLVLNCDWCPGTQEHAPVQAAYYHNDLPLFNQLYGQPHSMDRIKIDADNWKLSPKKWVRRFGG